MGIFHPPSLGDSEESKACSKLVLLLLSFLSLSREEQRLGEVCLPHTLAWSHVLTTCYPLHLQSLASAQARSCLEMPSLCCHSILHENASAPWWPDVKGGQEAWARGFGHALLPVGCAKNPQEHSRLGRAHEGGHAFRNAVFGNHVHINVDPSVPVSDSEQTDTAPLLLSPPWPGPTVSHLRPRTI